MRSIGGGLRKGVKRWRKISRGKKVAMFVTLFILCLVLFGRITYAQGLFPDKQELESVYRFLQYPMDNYSLDYSFEGEKGFASSLKAVAGAFYGLANILWFFSVGVCKLGIYLLDMGLRFDVVERSLDVVSGSLEDLFGIHRYGLFGGVFGNLFRFSVLALGVYVAFIGIAERKYTEVWKRIGMFMLVLIISIGFAGNSKKYLSAVNDGVNEVTQAISSVSSSLLSPETETEEIHDSGGSVARELDEKKTNLATATMCELLFDVQVRKPWLCLEFGTADEAEIEKRYGEGIIKEIESRSFGSKKREEKVKEIIEVDVEEDRLAYMTENGNNSRIGGIFFILISNIVIACFVGFFSILMILGQVMFLICAFLLPFAFFIALLPEKEHILKKSLLHTVMYLLIKIGLVVLLTVLFCVVGLIYKVSLELNVPVIVMQIVIACVFYYVFKNVDSLLRLVGISEGVRDIKGIRQSLREPEEKMKKIFVGAGGALGGYTLGKLQYAKESLTEEGRNRHVQDKKEDITNRVRNQVEKGRKEKENDVLMDSYAKEGVLDQRTRLKYEKLKEKGQNRYKRDSKEQGSYRQEDGFDEKTRKEDGLEYQGTWRKSMSELQKESGFENSGYTDQKSYQSSYREGEWDGSSEAFHRRRGKEQGREDVQTASWREESFREVFMEKEPVTFSGEEMQSKEKPAFFQSKAQNFKEWLRKREEPK
ncbi:hypothetical protein FYJ34_06745 [Clostridiaceae bacterium 68-1-5]|uniref:Uncharacterized protein n=1 Tax=Suipraeoptans intestinalis TaxID=2606628 RepID=A0A6N7USU3_9FIRM|nr:hypothetical protein [Suipraeoptans intestinalis]MSR93958.1 hypothetical protein [Suipraeoptans intestinalis]